MSYWEDLDDHLRRLEPIDLNLDYVGVSHLDCVSRVLPYSYQHFHLVPACEPYFSGHFDHASLSGFSY